MPPTVRIVRQRSFAAIAVVTLALGIGATTTCFSVLNAVALRPIPFPDPDKLVSIHIQSPRGLQLSRLNAGGVQALQQMREVFSGAVAYEPRTVTAAATDAAAERVPAAEVSGGLFSVAALGIYGIVSLMVTERSREFAIRRALGASSASVMRLVLGRGIGLSSAGVAAGLLPAVAVTAFLSSIFLGVRAFDGWVLAGSAALLGSIAIAASWWPARRAMGLDPMVALKQ